MRIQRLLTFATFVCACTLASAPGLADSGPPAPKAAAVAALPDAPLPDAPVSQTQTQAPPGASTAAKTEATPTPSDEGKQTKRILFIVPNFRSVSANQKLPPETAKEKFKTAALESFDYSAITFAAGQAGVAQAQDSFPEFRQGAAGYGRYFWHTFADQTDENLWVQGILPVALHQDSRYYTLGHGGFIKRGAYSFTRILITRTDDGNRAPNYSEVVGAGIASGISAAYYPSVYQTWTKVGQRWLTNVIIDGVTFSVKEFWPDVNNAIFHQKD
jgi:phage tail protein X